MDPGTAILNVHTSSAESGAHACVLRHLRRCSRCSQLTVSRFPLNRQSFRTYHLPQVTGILPALSATLFGVSHHLYCSSVFWGTLFGDCLCLLLMSFFCFWATLCGVVESVTYIVLVFLGDVVWCVVVSVTYIVFTHHLQVRASGYNFFNDVTLL